MPKKQNESGDLKTLQAFRQLIDLAAAEPNYKPANPALKLIALNPQYTAALAAANDVSATRTLDIAARTNREDAFDAAKPRITRVHGAAKASGAPKSKIEDLDIFRRKLTSKTRAKKTTANIAGGAGSPPPTADVGRSSSQLSYANLIGHLRGYFGVLATLPEYNPDEADLKLAALNSWADDLQTLNDAVNVAFVPFSQARGLRDQLIYQSDNSVVNTGLMMKEYIKSAFGTSSQIYKQAKALEFRRR